MQIKAANIEFLPDGRLKSATFDDIYFSSIDEARYVFLEQNNLAERFQALKSGEVFRICELGFGSGLNFFLTCKLWQETAPNDARLMFISTEKHPFTKEDFKRTAELWPELNPITDMFDYPDPIPGIHTRQIGNITLHLYLSEITQALRDLNTQIDCWFPDGFVPTNNPEMWQEDIFSHMARLSHQNTGFATFTAAGHVRRGLEAAGFTVEKVDGFGTKRDMLRGSYTKGEKHIPVRETITVIGAGVAGCALAYALTRKGYHVTLIEQGDTIASGASGNDVGVVYPRIGRDWSDQTLLHLHAFEHLQHVLSQLGDTGFTPCGVLKLGTTAEDRDKILALNLPEAIIQLADSETASDIAGIELETEALYLSQAGYLRPKKYCQALIAAGEDKIDLRLGETLSELPNGPVVIACGMQSTQFPETRDLPLEAVKGQVTYISETQTLNCVLNHKGHVTPAVDGRHCVGSTFTREEGFETEPSEDAHTENIEKLAQNVPGFLNQDPDILDGWVGYRAATPDRMPLIGNVPGHEDLYILSGLGSHGHTLAPLGAEVIASLISGDSLPVPNGIYKAIDPVRFDLRKKKRAG